MKLFILDKTGTDQGEVDDHHIQKNRITAPRVGTLKTTGTPRTVLAPVTSEHQGQVPLEGHEDTEGPFSFVVARVTKVVQLSVYLE